LHPSARALLADRPGAPDLTSCLLHTDLLAVVVS
jgi:hypothetical protein